MDFKARYCCVSIGGLGEGRVSSVYVQRCNYFGLMFIDPMLVLFHFFFFFFVKAAIALLCIAYIYPSPPSLADLLLGNRGGNNDVVYVF